MQAALALPTSPQPVAANAGRQPADVTLLNLIAAGDEGARAQTGSAIYTVPLGAAASDDALIDAIADDDRHAFEVLYSRHSTGVYRFALRFVADESIAEDVVNEVFLDVLRKAKSFEGRSQVSTWLLGITRNKALEITRRRTPEALDDEACEAIEDAGDNPECAILRKQNGSILLECLKNLSPAHREIIDLVYYHEKSVDDAAQTIRVPRNTVKTRMFYARSHLAKLLAEAGFDSALLQN